MSKTKQDTATRILDRALALINTRGLMDVGIREVAKDLGMRPGNVTYYFPTKEHLVLALMERLRSLNASTVPTGEVKSVKEFLDRYRQMFRNQTAFLGLVVNLVNIMRYPSLARTYRTIEKERMGAITQAIKELVAQGQLKHISDVRIDRLTSTISLISRFWTSEASLHPEQKINDAVMEHYIRLLATAFKPVCTKAGRKSLKEAFAS
ncbi:MAG: TetR family transcriptional regulator [Flavobacteriales bacterium]|nr:TetR family transcriptional regulator [Flavobacteriales bacterium]